MAIRSFRTLSGCFPISVLIRRQKGQKGTNSRTNRPFGFPRARLRCFPLQPNVLSDARPRSGHPLLGTLCEPKENNLVRLCPVCLLSQKLFPVVFQVVSGCFPDFRRSVSGALGTIGVCFPAPAQGVKPRGVRAEVPRLRADSCSRAARQRAAVGGSPR